MVTAPHELYAAVMVRRRLPPNQKDPIPGSLGDLVRCSRGDMSQQELANRIVDLGGKADQSVISKIEVPGDKLPEPPMMELLSLALGVALGDLYAAAGHRGHKELGRDSQNGGVVIRITEESPDYDLWRELSKRAREERKAFLRGLQLQATPFPELIAEAQQEPEAETGTN